MRIAAAVLIFVCLGACSVTPTEAVSDHALMRQDGWRQRQAALDAEAILDGMARARHRAQLLARTAR